MKKTKLEADEGKAFSLSENMVDRDRPRVPNLKLVKSRRGVAIHSKVQMPTRDPSEQNKAKPRVAGTSDRRGQAGQTFAQGRDLSRANSFDNASLAQDLEEFMYTFLQFQDRVSQLAEPKPMRVAGERCARAELGNAFDLSAML